MALKIGQGVSPGSSLQSVAKTPHKGVAEEHKTILTEIMAFTNGHKGTLMLVKLATGVGWKVESVYAWRAGSVQVSLSGPNGMTIRPWVGEREVSQYQAVWRI